MTTSEPTTGEIVEVLRENGDVHFGETEIACDQIADRLESQERELSGITEELERFRAFHERYAEQTSKKYVNDICALTASAEQAERERDALLMDFSTIERDGLCEVCSFGDSSQISSHKVVVS